MSANQCDGCKRGLPIVDGVHRGGDYDMIACTADRYGSSDMKQSTKDLIDQVVGAMPTTTDAGLLWEAFASLIYLYPGCDNI